MLLFSLVFVHRLRLPFSVVMSSKIVLRGHALTAFGEDISSLPNETNAIQVMEGKQTSKVKGGVGGGDDEDGDENRRKTDKARCNGKEWKDGVLSDDKNFNNICSHYREEAESNAKELVSVVRSRYRKTRGSRKAATDTVQWSNVPRSTRDEQLTRLKTACHYAWINFLNNYPSLVNNNVKEEIIKSPTKQQDKDALLQFRSTSDNNTGHVQSTEEKTFFAPTKATLLFKVLRSVGGDTERLMNLYKFLNFILSIVILFLKIVLVSFLLVFILYCLMVLHKPTQAFVSRHTQDFIYPFMRTIRFGSLPFVSRFPQLHELYEDACLLTNPFFEMNDVSCWPCENARHVIDLTGFSNFTSGYYHSGIPFVVKDAFANDVKIEDIYQMYEGDEKLPGSVLLKSSVAEIQTLEDLIKYNVKPGNLFSGDLHVAWKINRAQFARVMRKSFSRPYYIPNSTEISVQHFLFIDEPAADQYSLPVTEFANVFVMQADGRRLIVLIPVRHCRSNCKIISVVLQENDVLFYNWLFWRPISLPIKALEGNDLSITYVGSFY
ncbi:hypothetical protein Ocin01_04446 [Orchesella cincta]|uniref:Uncharacterized protein n=1 Tax=Orchesella cincta TaxID=48709 RepID=A0A1D2NAF6_ORCCI|nr:hypothetical protein Ocin01_04446 [Orchesella cincta]